MKTVTITNQVNLRETARSAFDDVLRSVDADRVVRDGVRLSDASLSVGEASFDLREIEKICAVAVGKAAGAMALALDEVLGGKIAYGVVSAPPFAADRLSPTWKIFRGGHPIPNEASLQAARAAIELLRRMDDKKTLVLFLISGGGSAMFEMPANDQTTLEELKAANRILVSCGATIAEINALRRLISKVKGGGLAACAPRSKKLTLIISDTNAGEAFNVASGLTIAPPADFSNERLQEIIRRYDLQEKLPPKIYEVLKNTKIEDLKPKPENQNYIILRENRDALLAAQKHLEGQGFAIEIAEGLVEQEIGGGCAEMVKSLIALRRKISTEKPVAVISGGEFVCPVGGGGRGGRNLESALRTAILFDELKKDYQQNSFAALFAGTDGIDGNSAAAGAICDQKTLERARKLKLDARHFLERSDSYNFFARLDDQIEIGATGTNVRDVRIMLAL